MIDEWSLFALVICFTVLVFLIETYLDVRQHPHYSNNTLPEELKGEWEQEDLEKSNDYHRDKSTFGFFAGTFHFVVNLFMLSRGMLWLWQMSGEYSFGAGGEYYHSIAFVIAYSLFSSLLNLPFSLWSTFVIEERHGFNKQTVGLYFKDLVKSELLKIAFGVPIVTGLIWIVKNTGDNFWFYLWAFMVALQLVIMVILFPVIAPIFYTLKEIPTDGSSEIGSAVAKLASRIQFPLTKLYEIDGSTRSSHSNAFFYGLGPFKRIVIFDTLMEQVDVPEVEAVLAHELGHWKKSHTYKLMLVQLVYLFVYMFAFGTVSHSKTLFQAFGFQQTPVIIGLILFGLLLGPIDTIMSLLMNSLTRKYEYEADSYAAKDLGYNNLSKALCSLLKANKFALHNDSWYSWRHHSHPTLLERIEAIKNLRTN